MKKLTKFTDSTGNPIYVDLSTVQAVSFDPHYSNTDGTTGITILHTGTSSFYVKEHLQIILAKVQGLDPAPAEVMFGSKNNE